MLWTDTDFQGTGIQMWRKLHLTKHYEVTKLVMT